MTNAGQIIGESDFKIVDKDELENMKEQGELNTDDISNIESKDRSSGNLKDDLIELGFLDYDNLSDEEKIIFDEMKNEKRDDFYELD